MKYTLTCWKAVLLACTQVCRAVWWPHVSQKRVTLYNTAKEPTEHPMCNSTLRGLPSEIKCPFDCPFLRLEPEHICEFHCVKPDECGTKDPFVNFADPSTYRCASCEVPACKLCRSRTTCEVCHENFRLSEGRCVELANWWMIWAFVAGVLLCVLLVVAWGLSKPEAMNGQANLNYGLECRYRSRFCQTQDLSTSELELYPLETNLCTNPVAGPGIMAHFRWHVGMMMWTACVLAAFGLLALIFHPRVDSLHPKDLHPADPLAIQACNRDPEEEQRAVWKMELTYFSMLLLIYILSSMSTILLARYLVHAFHNVEDDDDDRPGKPFMNDYALLVSGLPTKIEEYEYLDTSGARSRKKFGAGKSAEKQVELHLDAYFRELCPFVTVDIEGVSICWDFRGVVTDVNTEAERMRQQMHEQVEKLATGTSTAEQDPEVITTPTLEDDERVKNLLERVHPSGYAYVMFETVHDCHQALRLWERYTGSGKFRISLEPVHQGPKHVPWQKFGTSWPWFCTKFVLSISVIFISIPVLDTFAYAPNVMYVIYYHDVPLMNEGNLFNGMLLGALCGVLNLMISKLIEQMMDFIGFTSHAKSELCYLILFFLATVLNTVVDISTYVISSLGYSSVSLTELGSVDDRISKLMSVADQPGVQHQAFTVIMGSLPATLIAPALLEPLGTVLLPYLFSTRFVLRNHRGTAADAQEQLEYPAFDERRIGDIMVNVVLCTFMLAFTQHDLCIVFVYLLVYQLATYAWDHYRLLYLSSRTTSASFALAKWGCHALCFPCAIMATILVGRLYILLGLDFQEQYQLMSAFYHPPGQMAVVNKSWMQKYFASVMFTGPWAFLLHCLIHNLVMSLAIKHFTEAADSANAERILGTSPTSKSMRNSKRPGFNVSKSLVFLSSPSEAVSPVNYFNTNPVHCLRSKFILNQNPPVCWHKYGTEHLLAKTWEGKRTASLQRKRTLTAKSP